MLFYFFLWDLKGLWDFTVGWLQNMLQVYMGGARGIWRFGDCPDLILEIGDLGFYFGGSGDLKLLSHLLSRSINGQMNYFLVI